MAKIVTPPVERPSPFQRVNLRLDAKYSQPIGVEPNRRVLKMAKSANLETAFPAKDCCERPAEAAI
jgi:hypothetical protein